MKNKKWIFIIIVFFIALCCTISYFIYINKHSEKNESQNTYSLKNIGNHTIEKDEIEVTDMQIHKNESQVEVITKINNNSSEKINGFFIVIELLNSKGDLITSIAKKINEFILPNNSITITNYITGIDNLQHIESAKIKKIEKYK